MAKILCVLYDDPHGGMPKSYPRDDLPKIERYPDGQTLPTPKAIDFQPGELLGCVSGELGLAALSRKPGPHARRHLRQGRPRQRLRARAGRCRRRHLAAVLAGLYDRRALRQGGEPQAGDYRGIGSDHTDLQAAIERGITVAEVTYCNSISVAEHVVMMILGARPQLSAVVGSGEGRRLGHRRLRGPLLRRRRACMSAPSPRADRSAVLRRLKPFDMHLHYTDRHRLPRRGRAGAGRHLARHASTDMVAALRRRDDQRPLHPETENLFDAAMIARMKRGAYLVNTARGKIADRDAVVAALESGQLAGYAGDVWFPQPAPRDHPWRTMPHHGMTPHISGTSLSAQARYAAGTREILECFFEGRPIRDEYLIVQGGHLAGAGAHSYSEGDATGGSEEAARFKADARRPASSRGFRRSG